MDERTGDAAVGRSVTLRSTKELGRELRRLPGPVRREIGKAITSARPVSDPRYAALPAEWAAAQRRQLRVLVVPMGSLAIPGTVALISFFASRRGEQVTIAMLSVVMVFVILFGGLFLFRLHRRLRDAERINLAVHRAFVQQASETTGAETELFEPLTFAGLRELRAAIAVSIGLVIVLATVQLITYGPSALTRLTYAALMTTLWLAAPNAPRGVALFLIVVSGAAIADLLPPRNLPDSAIIAVDLVIGGLAIAGLWRSRPYRRELKARLKSLLDDEAGTTPC